jgi:hypothetical protein
MSNNEIRFEFKSNILKSSKSQDDKKYYISIIPNSPTKDTVNDLIELKAFEDKDCVNNFIKTGYLDYDHISVLGKDDFSKAQAIIGQPESLYVDRDKNVPVCEGFLFKGNPYVDNILIPALESGSSVFGASVGGKALIKSSEYDNKTNSKLNRISKILLRHVAICPLQKAVNQDTSVMRKSDDGTLIFEDYNEFYKSMNASVMTTDVSNMFGGQALQKQSLEGSDNLVNLIWQMVDLKILDSSKKIEKTLNLFNLSDAQKSDALKVLINKLN